MKTLLEGTPSGVSIIQESGGGLRAMSGCCSADIHYHYAGDMGEWRCANCRQLICEDGSVLWASVLEIGREARWTVEKWIAHWTGFNEADISVAVGWD